MGPVLANPITVLTLLVFFTSPCHPTSLSDHFIGQYYTAISPLNIPALPALLFCLELLIAGFVIPKKLL